MKHFRPSDNDVFVRLAKIFSVCTVIAVTVSGAIGQIHRFDKGIKLIVILSLAAFIFQILREKVQK